MHRAKKHMASKMAELKLGRKIIQQNVGNEGNKMVDALKEATARHSSKDKAKTLKQATYKMAFKIKFMVDRAEITQENSESLVKAWANLSVALLHALKPESKEPPIDDVVTHFETLKSASLDMLGPHLSEKNQKMLGDTLGYYGGRDFVTALVTDPEFEGEKATLFENLQTLMELADDPTILLNLEVVRSAPLFSDKYSSVISAVQTFWKNQVKGNEQQLSEMVYHNLFDTNPEYLSIFKSGKEEREHQLMKMFQHVIMGLDQFQKLTEEIRVLGKKHVALGVPYDGFEQMWNSMDGALEEMFGLRYKKVVRKSMSLVFNQLTDIMKSTYPADVDDAKEGSAEERIKEAQEFWESVENEQDQISHSLYESLFELHPEYEALFTGDVIELESKIMGMFNRVIRGLDKFDQLPSEMGALGKMHLGMGVPFTGFEHMWNSLDLTLLLIFGMRYNSRVRKTLSNSFHKIIVVLQECYPEAQRG